MNKDALASHVAAAAGLSQADAKAAVDAVFDGIVNSMNAGEPVATTQHVTASLHPG